MFFYSIRDVKAKSFGQPRMASSNVEAQRSLQITMMDPAAAQSPMVMWPGDFELWYVGDFDQSRGVFLSVEPEFLCSCVSLTKKPSPTLGRPRGSKKG